MLWDIAPLQVHENILCVATHRVRMLWDIATLHTHEKKNVCPHYFYKKNVFVFFFFYGSFTFAD